MPRGLLLILIVTMAMPAAGLACLWDYDTLEMERKQFPDLAELIAGKFLRHSKEFYEWRIADRQKRIEESLDDVRLRDDLAVAYDKTGQHEKAIETALKAQELKSNRYETLANLGTFHIHNGDLEAGLEFIGRAIEINPDAHFGREIYQRLLVEYVLLKRGDGPLPQPMSDEDAAFGPRGFAAFVLEKQVGVKGSSEKDVEIERAIKGVSGMLHFGHHDSPVLLEALADLLMAGSGGEHRHLATRAWLKASYSVDDESVAAEYRQHADQTLSMQTPGRGQHYRLALDEYEKQFQAELAEADVWFKNVREDEARWIAAGGDVDEEFRKKYYEPPALSQIDTAGGQSGIGGWFWNTGRFVLPVILLAMILLVWRRNHHAQRMLDSESSSEG
jgi:tetratricopeptide (TPR) repeat protein